MHHMKACLFLNSVPIWRQASAKILSCLLWQKKQTDFTLNFFHLCILLTSTIILSFWLWIVYSRNSKLHVAFWKWKYRFLKIVFHIQVQWLQTPNFVLHSIMHTSLLWTIRAELISTSIGFPTFTNNYNWVCNNGTCRSLISWFFTLM